MNGSGILRLLTLYAAAEEGGHAPTWLGVPLWIWQAANLALFFFLLWKFLAKPLSDLFRQRQLEVEERLKHAEGQRREAARAADEIRERMSQIEGEIANIRAQGNAEGEAEKAALIARADQEAERVGRDAEAQIARRVAAAVEELKGAAADLTATTAREIVAQHIDDSDRRRLLEEGVGQMKGAAR